MLCDKWRWRRKERPIPPTRNGYAIAAFLRETEKDRATSKSKKRRSAYPSAWQIFCALAAIDTLIGLTLLRCS